ncbi:hypothetical protein NE237_019676 [Protea cynaroides]|uniref:Uncharacterized protein n=1 Tax=Protea cynaroides TaxID=273540 RepID=A0A9Q0H4K0_9MAGN|nr:hypothetical protein NE237_019676 [Protea cynaroides]
MGCHQEVLAIDPTLDHTRNPAIMLAVHATRQIEAKHATAEASTTFLSSAEGTYAPPLEAHAKAWNDVPPPSEGVPLIVEGAVHPSIEEVVPSLPSDLLEGTTSKPATTVSPPNFKGLPPTSTNKNTPPLETNLRVKDYVLPHEGELELAVFLFFFL